VQAHPNADRLVLAEVDYGGAEPHVVVTGAPNLFPYKGQGRLPHPLKSVFAREGAKLYDGHEPGQVIVTLKGRPVRGVMSNAMLCSEKELGISQEHEGIIILEDDAPVGTPARDFLGEVVLDIDLTPNLARCLSIVGVAREVAALTGALLHIPDPQVQMDGPPVEEHVKVTVEEPDLCPRFTAALVEGITVKPSPHWMQRRLTHAGMRPINNIVDISNYVMLEWGEPTHAFDANKVQDQHLVARLARPGEKLVTLDGKERELAPEAASYAPPLMVCDPSGPLGIAGVMGGEESEVRETTTRILLEAAIWEPRQIRRTAQAFKIPSEASRRFERSVDIEVAPAAQRRSLELMRTLADGTVAQGLVDVYLKPWEPLTLELPPGEVTRIVGVQMGAHDIATMLTSLGFECHVRSQEGIGDMVGYSIGMGLDPSLVIVQVPSFRQDVTCLADLCEEVARVYGYENVPTTQMRDELPVSETHPALELQEQVRDVLVGCGLNDVITPSLTSMELVAQVNPSEAIAERYLRLSNSISPGRQYLQRSLLPTLLDSLATNLREQGRGLLFEIGNVFLPRPQPQGNAAQDDENWLPDELRYLGIAMAGPRERLSWIRSNGQSVPLMDFFDIKGVVETLLGRLNLKEYASFVPLTDVDDERFHPGRAAVLLVTPPDQAAANSKNKKKGREQESAAQVRIGVLGEVHPLACERLGVEIERVLAAELDLNVLFGLVQPQFYQPVSRYPATLQDLAVVADTNVPVEQIVAAIRRGAGEWLESLTLFDVYSGPQVGEGKRSLAYRLSFRAPDRTLSDEALAKVRSKIITVLERETGATIRA
jgi:phenylalanyl-tRNA synthetase beta chain